MTVTARSATWLVQLLLRLQQAGLRAVRALLFGRLLRQPAPSRILVFRVGALGDFILTIPALAALRKKFPRAQILLVTMTTSDAGQRSRVSQYTAGTRLPWLRWICPTLVDEVLPISDPGLGSLRRDIRPRVHAFGPDTAFLLSDVSAPALGVLKKLVFLRLMGVSGPLFGVSMHANFRLPLAAQQRAGLFRHHVFGPLLAVRECPAGEPVAETDIRFPLQLAEEDIAWVGNLVADRGWSAARLVAVSPGSLQPHKRWPQEKFAALLRALLALPGTMCLITGTAADRPLADSLAATLGERAVNLAGSTSVGQLAALLARCSLTVGNDGGTMHLASAVGCPTVSIVPGLEYPDSIEPWNDRRRAVRHPVACAPCYSFTHCPMGHQHCMTELPLEAVQGQCMRVLDPETAGPTGKSA